MATSYLDDFGDDAFDQLTGQGIKSGPNDSIPNLEEHYHFKPVFGLDYISLNKTAFCFNNPEIPARDFIELLVRCNKISSLTYSELHDTSFGNGYHFHEVDKPRLARNGLIDKFRERIPERKKALPPVYQFALYTDKETAPRVLGYIGKWGVFYLLWFDYGHLLYPRDGNPLPVDEPTGPALAVEKPSPVVDATMGLRADGRPKRPRIIREP